MTIIANFKPHQVKHAIIMLLRDMEVNTEIFNRTTLLISSGEQETSTENRVDVTTVLFSLIFFELKIIMEILIF